MFDSYASVPDYQTINTSSNSNWYFDVRVFHFSGIRELSKNPYGTITAYNVSGVSNMGISLTPLFYPPAAYALEYNAQTGFFIEFELGTTAKTTRHPNIADFHFVLYQHDPKWGQRSAVQRYQCFFPDWFERTVVGRELVCGAADATAHAAATGTATTRPLAGDFRLKFEETTQWDDSFTQQYSIMPMRYQEPWGWHVNSSSDPDSPAMMEVRPWTMTATGPASAALRRASVAIRTSSGRKPR